MCTNRAIEVSGVNKCFSGPWRPGRWFTGRKSLQVLKDISFSVRQGTICCVLGPNGAGKSTMMKILATLILPDSGTVTIAGYDALRLPHKIRNHISLVNTNERSFYWRLTGWQNLDFFGSIYGLRGAEKKRRIDSVLTLTGMQQCTQQSFMTYSSGQRQKLAIARALLTEPDILFLDEPTNSLDPVSAHELQLFFKDRIVSDSGKTVLWCTHNLHEAEEVCDQVIIINEGKVTHNLSQQELQGKTANNNYFLELGHCMEQQLAELGLQVISVIRNGERLQVTLLASKNSIASIVASLCNQKIAVYECRNVQKEVNQELFSILSEKESTLPAKLEN